MRKKICTCIVFVFLCSVLCLHTSAYKPSGAVTMTVRQNGIPQDTVYIDLLLPIQPNDERFVEQKDINGLLFNIFNQSISEFTSASEIANYDDGYYSYLFHFKDGTIYNDYWDGREEFSVIYGESRDLLDDMVEFENCKLAFVDAEGNILAVSNAFAIENKPFRDFDCLIVTGTSVSAVYHANPYQIAFAILLCLVLIAMCAGIFSARKKRKAKATPAT